MKNIVLARLLDKSISSFTTSPPIGILCLKTVLRKEFPKNNYIFFDNSVLKEEQIKFTQLLKPISPCIILFSITYTERDLLKKYANIAKKINKNNIIIAGGSGITCSPEEYKDYIDIDSICSGQAENTIINIFNDIKNNKLKNIYKQDYNLKIQIPTPDWENFNFNNYSYLPCNNNLLKKTPYAPVMAQRGCPFNCPFCNSILGNKINSRKIDSIIEELKNLKNKGVREIHIADDTFNISLDYAKNFLLQIIKENLNFSISFQGLRIENTDYELFELMKKAGGYYYEFGIQHIDSVLLNNISRQVNVSDINKKLLISSKLGLISEGHFMYNLPEETYSQHKENFKFAKKLPIDFATFFKFTPFPGTSIGNKYINNFKKIPSNSFHFYNTDKRLNISNMTNNELITINKNAYKDYYYRTSKILSLLKKIPKNSITIKRILNTIIK
ncbi:MAG: radical SAM protein [Candidatus Muirbacterium halophilum]|nr:radical SAM protein [Candidatus Muirbacterium halophilum]MCK9474672.1 radical SAM protein [Candidatus Muirbacterium halophilum]